MTGVMRSRYQTQPMLIYGHYGACVDANIADTTDECKYPVVTYILSLSYKLKLVLSHRVRKLINIPTYFINYLAVIQIRQH
jgi:hypothetical protein